MHIMIQIQKQTYIMCKILASYDVIDNVFCQNWSWRYRVDAVNSKPIFFEKVR